MSDLIKVGEGAVHPSPRPLTPPRDVNFDFSEGRTIDFARYYRLLLRRKWVILAVALTFTVGAGLQVYTATPLYTATARLQIDPESNNVLPYDDPFQSSLYFLASDSYLRTQAEIISSRALALRVVKKMRLQEDPHFAASVSSGIFSDLIADASGAIRELITGGDNPVEPASEAPDPGDSGLETAAEALRSRITVSPLRGTRIMEVYFTAADPGFAAAVVNVVTQEYIQQNFDKRFDATAQASDFLESKLDILKSKVEDSEEHLIGYARENNIVNVDERQNIVMQKLASLSAELTQVESQLITEAARREALKDASVESFPQSLKNNAILALEAKLLGLDQDLAKLSIQYGPEWPAVRQTRGEIDAVQTQILEEKRQALQKANEAYDTVLTHREKLLQALEEQKLVANQLYQDSIQYNILKREVDTNKDLYEGVLQRLKQAGISVGLKSSNLHVIDDARPPSFASWPSKRRAITTGLLVGLFFGFGLAFLLEMIDNTIKTPEDLEASVGLPALSVIPSLQAAAGTRALLPQTVGGATETLMDRYLGLSKSQVWEAYRSLRTSILLSHSGRPPQTVLVTSALPGEGKTTTSLHTAVVLAQTGARTLLIDMDMRKPALARIMGVDGSRGMSNYLSGNSDLSSQIQPGKIPNLFVLAAGPHPPNPAELIGSDRMLTGLSLVKDYFKYIVIDSPPIMSVTDALILANMVDGVVLVIHGGKTPRDAVQKASERLVGVGGRVLGALINNVDIRKSEYSSYYRYYYYYDDYSEKGTRSKGA